MQYEVIKCPFCEVGDISCYYLPSVWGEKHTGRSSLGRGKSVSKSKEQLIVRTDCPNCHKSQKEIQEWLK